LSWHGREGRAQEGDRKSPDQKNLMKEEIVQVGEVKIQAKTWSRKRGLPKRPQIVARNLFEKGGPNRKGAECLGKSSLLRPKREEKNEIWENHKEKASLNY